MTDSGGVMIDQPCREGEDYYFVLVEAKESVW